jgi:hypothetical protein
MTKEELEAAIDRVRAWPEERQDMLLQWITGIEEADEGDYEPTDEERADLEAASEEVRRGEIATDEQVKALFDRYK